MSFFWFILVMRIMTLGAHILGEFYFARYLPWWRRYASIPFLVLGLVMMATRHCDMAGVPSLLATVIFLWNSQTNRRNRRNKRDHMKLEAEARQTQIQAKAWRREVVEAQ